MSNEKIYMRNIKLEDKKHLVQLTIIREVIFLLGAMEAQGLYSWTISKFDLDDEGNLVKPRGNVPRVTSLNCIPVKGLVYKNRLERIRLGFLEKTYIDVILVGSSLIELEEIHVIWKDNDKKEHQEVIRGRVLEGLILRVLEKCGENSLKTFNDLQSIIEKDLEMTILNEEYYEEMRELGTYVDEGIYPNDWD